MFGSRRYKTRSLGKHKKRHAPGDEEAKLVYKPDYENVPAHPLADKKEYKPDIAGMKESGITYIDLEKSEASTEEIVAMLQNYEKK